MKLLSKFIVAAVMATSGALANAQTVDVPTCMSALSLPMTECEALVALYNSTDGDNWSDNTGWGTANPNWHGVACTSGGPVCGGGNVVRINLGGDGLNGTIPTEIGDLPMMTTLVLGDNNLTGPIPASINNLTSLEVLRVSDNSLSGPIPDIGSLTNLRVFGAANNDLTGAIPSTIDQTALDSAPPPSARLDLSGNFLDADANRDALIPAGLEGFFADIASLDLSAQRIPPVTFPVPVPFWATALLALILGRLAYRQRK